MYVLPPPPDRLYAARANALTRATDCSRMLFGGAGRRRLKRVGRSRLLCRTCRTWRLGNPTLARARTCLVSV